MNTNFNTIETIRTDAAITNKSEAYLAACDSFEKEASNYANNESFITRKSAEEVSLAYKKAENEDCEYTISSIKKAMREVFMQAGLIEKERIDYSKMSVRELHSYAHVGETYNQLSRSYK